MPQQALILTKQHILVEKLPFQLQEQILSLLFISFCKQVLYTNITGMNTNQGRMFLPQPTWSREYKWQANQKWGALSGSSRKIAQIDMPPNRTSIDTNSDVETDNIYGQLASMPLASVW